MSDSLYTAAYTLQIREKYRVCQETVQHFTGYWTAMADALTFPNRCVSSCFTLNAQQAASSAASSSYIEEVDISLPKSKTCVSVPADFVNKHNVSEFL